jgi:CRISPR-associated protein Csb2
MKPAFCISFRFIQPYPLFHGRADGGDPEWPPSPMRAFQALLNAACLRMRGRPLPPEIRSALKVLEVLRPSIIAPRATLSTTGHRAYVPHNQTDLVAAAWDRGNIDASIASHRIEKDFRPYRIETIGDDLPTIHYLYPLDAANADPEEFLNTIRPSVRSIHCLGWGIDQVIADATLVASPPDLPVGERWTPTPRGGRRLHAHRGGSLDALAVRHDRFLKRLIQSDWTPVPPLNAVDQVRYRRETDSIPRPHAVFRLLNANDDTVNYPQSKLIHIAGMVKHLAIETMKRNPPRDLRGRVKDEWVEAYVGGHQSKEGKDASRPHTQFSYIPLQSIGTPNTDPGVRRVMIVAPVGDETWLEHLAARLDGILLKPLPNTKLPQGTRLERIGDNKSDGVRDAYLESSIEWASVTPVILPGHDDHKPEKTRKLIEKALQQSGVDQPCEFEWSAFSQFRKMLPAHKYREDPNDPAKRILINYVRPDHLLEQSAVHLTLRFTSAVAVRGPITLGAGRHCGFGLMAGIHL